jgi:hypothetical protein
MQVSCLAYSSTLKMQATCSSEMSVDIQRTTWHYIPKAGLFVTAFVGSSDSAYWMLFIKYSMTHFWLTLGQRHGWHYNHGLETQGDIYILISMHLVEQAGISCNISDVYSEGDRLKSLWDTDFPTRGCFSSPWAPLDKCWNSSSN